jgi:hypothetical protein
VVKKGLTIGLLGALTLSLIGGAASLSGAWNTTIVLDPQQASLSDALRLEMILTAIYTVSPWTFTSASLLDESGWIEQEFRVVGALGPFSLSSVLQFDPGIPAFDAWTAAVDVELPPGALRASFTLVEDDVRAVLSGWATLDGVTLGAETTLGEADNGLCDLDWVDLSVCLEVPFCCSTAHAVLTFDTGGFRDLVFTTEALAFPAIPYLSLDVQLTYTVQTKALTLTPRIVFLGDTCVELFVESAFSGGEAPGGSGLTLESFTVQGVSLSCELGGVSLTALSYWGDGAKPGRLLDTPYWEVYAIRSIQDACCGRFGFDLAVYFLENGMMLFDVSLIRAHICVQLADQVRFRMGVEMDVEASAFSEWALGFDVTW